MNDYIKRHFNRNFIILFFYDVVTVNLSLFLSTAIRYESLSFIVFDNIFSLNSILLINFIKILSFKFSYLYRGMWRYTSIWDVINIIKANMIGTLIITSFIYFAYGFATISRTLFIIDYLICTSLIGISRVGIRIFLGDIFNLLTKNKSNNLKRIILVGAGFAGQEVARQLLNKHSNKYRIVGFVDDNIDKYKLQIHGVIVVGKTSDLSKSLVNKFDEIFICCPSATEIEMRNIIANCKRAGKVFKTLPSMSEIVLGKISVNQLREVSIFDILGRDEISLDKKSIKKFISGKRVLITGGGGSIGSELVRQCLKFNPAILLILDISELNLFEIDREVNNGNSEVLFKTLLFDIRDSQNLEKVFSEFKPQIVFHAAAYKHVPMQEQFPLEAIKTNIFGTFNLSDLSVKYNVDKFVLVSTDKAVRPTNVMGATKRIAELIVQNKSNLSSKTEFVAVRFGNVLGSSGSVIPIFQEQIRKGGPVTVTDPDMERFFMSIPEASQLILQTCSIGVGGEVFILDMGKPVKIINVAKELIRLSGYDLDEINIKIVGQRPGEKKIEELAHPNEVLDSTKHEKIFVLNDVEKYDDDVDLFFKKVNNLEKKLHLIDSEQARVELSLILPEYIPDSKHKNKIDSSKNTQLKN